MAVTTDAVEEIVDGPGGDAAARLIPLHLIRPAPDNLRGDLGDLADLRASMRASGLYQRILVAPVERQLPGIDDDDDDCHFVCVDGHRRLEAARLEGWTHIPADVRLLTSDADRTTAMLVTALSKKDLAPSEEAEGFARLIALGMTQRAIADMVGCDQSHVSKTARLAALPVEAREAVDSGRISREIGVRLTALPAEEAVKLADRKTQQWEIESAIRKHEMAEKKAKAEAEARQRGVTVIDASDVRYSEEGETPMWLTWLDGRKDCTPAQHVGQPCHAEAYQHTGAMASVCTNPASHEELTPDEQIEAAKVQAEADEARHPGRRRRVAGKPGMGAAA